MLNLSTLLEESARTYPDRDALVLGPTRLTYSQVDAAANQVANLLVDRGIEPGDKVALMCPNLPYFSIVYYGILMAGAVVVPLNVLLKAREVAYHLDDSDAKALFAFEGTPELPIGTEAKTGFDRVDACRELFVITADPATPSPIADTETFAQAVAGQPTSFETVATDADDTAVILYTSGTTGQPKGAELRHRNMRDNALATKALFGCDETRPDTYLCVLPLFHSFGQTVIQNGGFAFGGTVVVLPRFEPGPVIETMLKESVTVFAGVPTMYWGLLGALENGTEVETLAKNLRMAISGGAALPVEIHREVEKRLGVTIAEGYGLSETSPVASFAPYGEPPRPGSIGTPIPGVSMKLIDPASWSEIEWSADAIGEIAIKGHNVMKGYYRREKATAEVIDADGWFRTGDLARRDADGFYYIVDRSKDLIIRGGFNVYPREVEEVLVTHPDVSLAAVVGVPHESHGEEIKAFVILEPGSTLATADLVAWAKTKMASYKYPRLVEFVASLPMTATGKILKRELTRTSTTAAATPSHG
ncbi:long-chain fatty acid--CoA ligase [Nocardioides sp. KC13]|uniref:Long-chain fatty acid--CoA ligase n=1 Tax=Nocardioides turkmenicus TaxID=2711220 RepID=A0A6M1R7Z7_9ACTN|nr:long-chain fatty acid--CoA ligase [Nocardioides sp. KC13]NGN94791.1 long-chain fatty acid--CoA ligase [Nocardioides sp. KC13]